MGDVDPLLLDVNDAGDNDGVDDNEDDHDGVGVNANESNDDNISVSSEQSDVSLAYCALGGLFTRIFRRYRRIKAKRDSSFHYY